MNEAVFDARTLGRQKMFVLGLQHMFAMFGTNRQRDIAVNFSSMLIKIKK